MPAISVLIPAYRRPELLKRAVASVKNQGFTDWDCYVSDDENPAGETWDYLQKLAGEDARFHVMRNPPPHGQVANLNRLMLAANGTWLKFLHDDDVLRPNCLAALAAAVEGQDGVAGVSCGVAEYRDGKHVKDKVFVGRALVERIESRQAVLGLYLQDEVGGGVPTQRMVRRSTVEAGLRWEQPEGIRSCVDALFTLNTFARGDSLIVRAPLVEWHQGDHGTVTGSMADEELDAEYAWLRARQFRAVDPALRPPSLRVSLQYLKLVRATARLSRRRFAQAALLAAQAWHPRAWQLAFQWYMRRSGRPGWSRIPRVAIPDEKVRRALGGAEDLSGQAASREG